MEHSGVPTRFCIKSSTYVAGERKELETRLASFFDKGASPLHVPLLWLKSQDFSVRSIFHFQSFMEHVARRFPLPPVYNLSNLTWVDSP